MGDTETHTTPPPATEPAAASGAAGRRVPSGPRRKYQKISFNPFAQYRGVVRRFVLLYKHAIGLFAGAFVASVNQLPAYQKKGLHKGFRRATAAVLRKLLKKELRDLPFEVQLRSRLQMLGPTYVKLGQVMAIREDILPPSITDELKKLLDQLPEIPFEVVKAILEDNLGGPVEEFFAEIDPRPLGSASIGQTHRARLHSGETVVVKVIKPGIRELILQDLKLLQILAGLLEKLIPRYQPQQIINEFCNYTEKEINLVYEADHAEIFAANFADDPDIVFPRIYREFTTRDVLCMEYFDGLKPTDPAIFDLPPEALDQVVDIGARAIIRMLYDHGFFHADLHAGNIIVLPDLKIGFIDLGMVGRFEERIKRNLLFYFNALVHGDIEHSAKYILAMAQPGKKGDPEGFRRAVSDLLRRYRVQNAHGDMSLAELILESLKIGAQFNIFFPVEMTLMVKALVTFEGVGRHLKPKLDVVETSRKHVQKVYEQYYHPRFLTQQLIRNLPELLDLLTQFPELVSESARQWERSLRQRPPENPLVGIKSTMLAGSLIIAAVITLVQGGPQLLWILLFLAGGILALFGK